MATHLLRADAVLLQGRLAKGVLVEIEDGSIQRIGRFDPGTAAVEHIAGTLLPGLIDLQVNGAGGRSVDEATPRALDIVANAVRQGGASAFLPTLITAPWDRLTAQLGKVSSWIGGYAGAGATPLGIHLEGPFLEVPGAHDPACFLDPTPERIEEVLAAADGRLRLLTLAPGRPGAARAVEILASAGVATALGHGQGEEGVADCVAAGAVLVTHLFNAMGHMSAREPGLAGLALDEPRLGSSLILDGIHIGEVMVRNAYRCLGPERMILVTDCVAAMGMPDGEFRLAGMPIFLRGGTVRDKAGVIAGSALQMAGAAENFLAMVPEAGPETLAKVAAANPARIIGAVGWGEIRPGGVAEFCLLKEGGKLHSLSLPGQGLTRET